MKFGKELLFNSVPDWQEQYVNYAELKELITRITLLHRNNQTVTTSGFVELSDEQDAIKRFTDHIDKELTKLDFFMRKQEQHAKETLRRVEEVVASLSFVRPGRTPRLPISQSPLTLPSFSVLSKNASIESPLLKPHQRGESESAYQMSPPLHLPPVHSPIFSSSQVHALDVSSAPTVIVPSSSVVGNGDNTFANNPHMTVDDSEDDNPRQGSGNVSAHPVIDPVELAHYGERAASTLVALYGRLNDLLQYRHLNYEALRKALKKLDKNTTLSLSEQVMPRVDSAYFVTSTLVEELKEKTESLYTATVWDGDRDLARKFLQQNTRDLIVFRRNIIWKDMVAAESKKTTIGLKSDNSVWTFKKRALILCITVFVVLLFVPLTFLGDKHAQRCGAMLVLLILLWVTEAIPLYVTSISVPFLSVALGVLPGKSAEEAATEIVGSMMTEVILLVLGGFTIASALSKFQLDRMLATMIISRSGTNPRHVAFAVMMVGAFLSMFLSNVAAPVLCVSVMSGTIRALPRTSTFRKGLLLAIAFSCNVGGMLTPIASPQNVVAMQVLNSALDSAGISRQPLSFGNWILVALPCGFLLIVCIYVYLFYVWYHPDIDNVPVVPFKREKLSKPQIFTILVSVVAIGMWCAEPALKKYLGPEGVMAVAPMVLFYGSGLLRKDDFDSLPWNVVFLVAGGVALSKAVKESALLDAITSGIEDVTDGNSIWVVTACFVALISIVTSLISHTVGAMIILPVVAKITCAGADECDVVHTEVLVMCCAMMCSGAMMLPVSSFPNVTAISCEDELGVPYLCATDLVKTGGPFTLFVALFITTVGFGLSKLVFAFV